jgi:uncharacterized metal-binding protein
MLPQLTKMMKDFLNFTWNENNLFYSQNLILLYLTVYPSLLADLKHITVNNIKERIQIKKKKKKRKEKG